MKNLVLITSVINTPNIPLSYTNIRSIYTIEERFLQTQKTIESLRKKISNLEILLVECSDLKDDYVNYFKLNCDHFINLNYNIDSRNKVFSQYKAVGETELITKGIEYIELNNLKFDNFFKISGRYYLLDSFDIEIFNNKQICCRNIEDHITATILYKIPYFLLFEYKNFLIINYLLTTTLSQEEIMRKFVNNYNIFDIKKLHVEGNIAICGTKFNC